MDSYSFHGVNGKRPHFPGNELNVGEGATSCDILFNTTVDLNGSGSTDAGKGKGLGKAIVAREH